MFGPYWRIVRTRGYLPPFILALSVSLTLGMVSLGLLIAVQQRTGSLTSAGLVPAAFGLGNACGLIVQGRLIDRFGQTRVLIPTSVLCGLSLLAAIEQTEITVVAGLAFLAGASFPATISSMRVLTAALIVDERLRLTGYALLTVSFGLAMVTGPLLVSGLVAVSGPTAAVVIAAAVISCGGTGFALTAASRSWQPSRRRYGTARWRRGLRTLLVSNTALGFAAGAIAVALPAAALAHGQAAAAGIGFAAMSTGDLAGGLVYGVIRWRISRPVQLAVSTAAAAGADWLAVSMSGSLPALFGALLCGGALGACVPICSSALLDDLAPPGTLTTSYTVMVGSGLVAGSAGNAVAGVVAGRAGVGWAFALGAGAVSLAAIWVAARRSALVPASVASGR